MLQRPRGCGSVGMQNYAQPGGGVHIDTLCVRSVQVCSRTRALSRRSTTWQSRPNGLEALRGSATPNLLNSQAVALLVEVLATRRRVLGARHPVTLLAATNLATIHQDGQQKNRRGRGCE